MHVYIYGGGKDRETGLKRCEFKPHQARGTQLQGVRSGGEAVTARSFSVGANGVTLRMPSRSLNPSHGSLYSFLGMICAFPIF
jgi:hypothetical protein